jgi:hypothetical protein
VRAGISSDEGDARDWSKCGVAMRVADANAGSQGQLHAHFPHVCGRVYPRGRLCEWGLSHGVRQRRSRTKPLNVKAD